MREPRRPARTRPLTWFDPRPLPRGDGFAAQAVRLDEYDLWHFRRLGAHDPALRSTLAWGRELQRIAFDLYGLLYKPKPVWIDSPGVRFQRAVLELASRQLGVDELRRRTVLSEWATVLALRGLLKPLSDALGTARRDATVRRAAEEVEAAAARGEPIVDSLSSRLRGHAGATLYFATKSAADRIAGRAFDDYEATVRALAEFDRRNDLMRLTPLPQTPSNATRPAGGRSVRQPPLGLAGLPPETVDARRALVERMLASGEYLHEAESARQGMIDKAAQEVREGKDTALVAAFKSARQSADDLHKTLAVLTSLSKESDRWGREAGRGIDSPLEEVLALGKLLQDDRSLLRVVELAGRWTETMRSRVPRGRDSRGRSEVHGIALGGEIERLLSSELLLLRRPALRRVLLARVAERRAAVIELRGPHLLGRGPVILAVDTSGSMYGSRLVFARALALAMAVRCHMKRRPLHVVTFGAPGEMREFSILPHQDLWSILRDVIGFGFGGGTSFDTPLLRICELVGEKPWSQADAVIVTDGECDTTVSTRSGLAVQRRRTDLRVIGVLVGRGDGLAPIADVLLKIDVDRGVADGISEEPLGLLAAVEGRL